MDVFNHWITWNKYFYDHLYEIKNRKFKVKYSKFEGESRIFTSVYDTFKSIFVLKEANLLTKECLESFMHNLSWFVFFCPKIKYKQLSQNQDLNIGLYIGKY